MLKKALKDLLIVKENKMLKKSRNYLITNQFYTLKCRKKKLKQ